VSAVSIAVLAAAISYAVAPSQETISARVFVRAVAAGSESITGAVLERGKPATHTSITIYRRRARLKIRLKTREVNARGRFSFPEPPGSYLVLVRHDSHSARILITLRRGRSVFIKLTIKKSGGLLVGPIIFNY
jgi:hypothetical protein